jgi:hypothetical protein
VIHRGGRSEVRVLHDLGPVDGLDLNKARVNGNVPWVETIGTDDVVLDLDALALLDEDVVVREIQLGSSINERHQQVGLSALIGEGEGSLGGDVRESVGGVLLALVRDSDVELGGGVKGVVQRDFTGRDDRFGVDGSLGIDKTRVVLGDCVKGGTIGGGRDPGEETKRLVRLKGRTSVEE